MMRQTTISKLDDLVSKLVANAKFATVDEVLSSKKTTLFDLLKYGIRKESKILSSLWNVNVVNVAKTPRQLNYVASEVEYKLRKRFLKDSSLKSVWLAFESKSSEDK